MMLRFLIASNWMLMLIILTLADNDDAGALNAASRLATLAILAYLAVRSWSDPRRADVAKHMLPWWCFGAWAVASTAWSPLWSFSLGQSVSLVLLLLLSFCTAMLARRIADISRVVQHLCLALLLLSTVLLAARFLAPETLSLTRGGKGLFHATNASAMAALAMVLITSARLIFRWRWSYWMLWPSVAIHSSTLFLASNRASLVITFLVVAGIVVLQASAGWRWLLLTAGSFACGAYVTLDPGFLLVDQAGGGVAEYMSRDQSTAQLAELSGRDEMWTVIWESFLRSPWLGHGYFVSSETGKLKVWYLWSNWTAHNFWLQVLVSTGVVGAALLAWGLISYAVRLLGARTDGVGLRRVAFLGAAVLIWQSAWGVTNESFVGPLQPESIVFFGVLGMVTGKIAQSQSAGNAPAAVRLLRNNLRLRPTTGN